MKIFSVSATRRTWVQTTIEAESIGDAFAKINNNELDIDWQNGDDVETNIFVEEK
jgi:hypothetical protein|tara:strand:- start:486 stop:650 length:165 start_codon:yes stop_codon:yes gene_type:complete